MDLSNVSNNRSRSKKRDFNDFSKVTDLVKKYKASNDERDLLDVIEALEGIINTYTLILTPANSTQNVGIITPYMCKFLGMFLSPEEKANANVAAYRQAIARVRWIMRRSSYDDIYSQILMIMVQAIKGMKIVKNVDCIYYIQLIVRYKLHDLVMKASKDAGVSIADVPILQGEEEESAEEVLDRLSYQPENAESEDDAIYEFYNSRMNVKLLMEDTDIFKVFGPYEKYLIYLRFVLGLKDRQILSILRNETSDGLKERLEDIEYKIEIINNEGE